MSKAFFTLLALGMVISQAGNPITSDWTVEKGDFTAKCANQVKDIKAVWTGDCEGSYAAMVASVIQDNICLTFDKNSVTPADLKKLSDIKVSFQEIICNCEACQQYATKGCEGGSVENTLNFIRDNGFVGGAKKEDTANIPALTLTWKAPFVWNYANCLSYFKSYCDWNANKCQGETPFDKNTFCGAKPATGTDLNCPNVPEKKIKDVRQMGIFKGATKIADPTPINISQALSKGPLISTMELHNDIFANPGDSIYVPRSGSSIGHFAVKIVGCKNIDTVYYWMVMLPFDLSVGKDSIVWVRAGLNIGGLEANVFSVAIVNPADLITTPPPA